MNNYTYSAYPTNTYVITSAKPNMAMSEFGMGNVRASGRPVGASLRTFSGFFERCEPSGMQSYSQGEQCSHASYSQYTYGPNFGACG